MSKSVISEVPSTATLKLLLDDTVDVQEQIISVLELLGRYSEGVERRLTVLEMAAKKPVDVVVKLPKNRKVLIFAAGFAIGVYVYKKRRKIEIVLENANASAKQRFTSSPTANGEVHNPVDDSSL